MTASPIFPVWHWLIPIICGGTIGLASIVLKKALVSQLHDESALSLQSFFSTSLRTFIKKQMMYLGGIVGLISIAAWISVRMGFHHSASALLIIWGLIGGMALSITLGIVMHEIGSRLNRDDRASVSGIGQSLMAILIAVSVVDIWIWISVIVESITRNWFGIGDALVSQITSGSQWTPAILHAPEFQHGIQHHITMLCLALVFGGLIHTLFIVFSSRIMTTSLNRSAQEIIAKYPGLGAYDLRNPIGIPSTLIELINRSWTKAAVTQSLVITAILGVIGIESVTLAEGLEGLSPSSMSLGLLLAALGAGCTVLALVFGRGKESVTFLGSWLLVGLASLAMAMHHELTISFLHVYWASMAFSMAVFGLVKYESLFKRIIEGRLERFFVIYTLILSWIGSTFWLGGGHTNMLMGINGIGLATLVMLATSIPLMSAHFSNSIQGLHHQYQSLLGHDTQRTTDSVFKSEISVGLITMGTSWIWFFLFMDWVPWIMTHITRPEIINRIILTANAKLGTSLTTQNWVQSLRALDVAELDGLLSITPTNPGFVMGVFVAILFGILIGIVLLRFIRFTKEKLTTTSITELNSSDEILEGRALPDYSVPLNTISSIGAWGALCTTTIALVVLTTIAFTLGWGGYAGMCLGFVVMEGFVYVAHISGAKDDLTDELEMASVVLTLLTRTSIVLICIIGGILLNLGLGLLQ